MSFCSSEGSGASLQRGQGCGELHPAAPITQRGTTGGIQHPGPAPGTHGPLLVWAGGCLTWSFGEGGRDAQAVFPEVRAAVGDGAVAEEVAVAEGVVVGDGAAIVAAVAADVPLLAVGPTSIVDPVLVQAGGQLPAGAHPGSQGRLGQQPEAEQGPQQAHGVSNVPRPAAAAEGGQ